MPPRFRTLFGALGVFILASGLFALWSASQLTGWPFLRGIGGALVATILGGRLTWMAARDAWPSWLAAAMGDEDAT